jgi:hypothetical protein
VPLTIVRKQSTEVSYLQPAPKTDCDPGDLTSHNRYYVKWSGKLLIMKGIPRFGRPRHRPQYGLTKEWLQLATAKVVGLTY